MTCGCLYALVFRPGCRQSRRPLTYAPAPSKSPVAHIPAIRLLWCFRTMTFSLRAVAGVTLWLELVIGRDLSLPIDLSAICNICAIDASAGQ